MMLGRYFAAMININEILVWVVSETVPQLDEFSSIERSDIGKRYFVGARDDWHNILGVARLRGYRYVLQLKSTDTVDRNILRHSAEQTELLLPLSPGALPIPPVAGLRHPDLIYRSESTSVGTR